MEKTKLNWESGKPSGDAPKALGSLSLEQNSCPVGVSALPPDQALKSCFGITYNHGGRG